MVGDRRATNDHWGKRNKETKQGPFPALFLFRGSWPAAHVTIYIILAEDLKGEKELIQAEACVCVEPRIVWENIVEMSLWSTTNERIK